MIHESDAQRLIKFIEAELATCVTIEDLKLALHTILADIIESIPKHQDPMEE